MLERVKVRFVGGPADGQELEVMPCGTVVVPFDPAGYDIKPTIRYVSKRIDVGGLAAAMPIAMARYEMLKDGTYVHVGDEWGVVVHADCEDCGTVGEGI